MTSSSRWWPADSFCAAWRYWWDSAYGATHDFQKLEIYEVRHDKIVAEYDG